jgi:DsbC/DsbD-like thiol-disulfide interchange protein
MALEVTPASGSHVYYINPGEMGLPVELSFEDVPEGLEVSPLRYPVPHRTKTGDLATFGYSETTRFPFQITVSDSFEVGEDPVFLKGKASWLACDDESCIPGKADLTLDLTSAEPIDLGTSLAVTPEPAGDDWEAKLTREKDSFSLQLTAPESVSLPKAWDLALFSETPEFEDPVTPAQLAVGGRVISARITPSEYFSSLDSEGPVTLVLAGLEKPVFFDLPLPNPESGQ